MPVPFWYTSSPTTSSMLVEARATNIRSGNDTYCSKKFTGIMNTRNAHGNHNSFAHSQPAKYKISPKISTTNAPAMIRGVLARTPTQYNITAANTTDQPAFDVPNAIVRSRVFHFQPA